MSKIWIAYDDSPERLPIAVADNPRELAKLIGGKSATISSKACDFHRGRTKDSKYVYVEVENV